MRTVFDRNRLQQTATVAFALLIAAAIPGLAEEPYLEEPLAKPTPAQQRNVQRLILTNECANCDLAGVALLEAHLIGADLRSANLTGANLTGSNLEGADLTGANLTNANLTNTFLTDTSLANTLLVGVNFTGAHLYNTDVQGATMEGLNLVGAEIFNTPISVGGAAPPDEILPLKPQPMEFQPVEPLIPFEDPQPPLPYPESLLDPIL